VLDRSVPDHLLVFRQPWTASEIGEAEALLDVHLDSEEAGDGLIRVYALVDIERCRPPSVVGAVEVSAPMASRWWRVLRAGGDAAHQRRLATELARVATMAGVARLTVAPEAPPAALRLLREWPGVVDAGRWLSVEL
jgi:hypothetical protein